MKKFNIPSAFPIIFSIFLLIISCGKSAEERARDGEEGQPHAVGSNGYNYTVVTIDGCEYLLQSYDGRTIVHKGNCKYCIERKKNEGI